MNRRQRRLQQRLGLYGSKHAPTTHITPTPTADLNSSKKNKNRKRKTPASVREKKIDVKKVKGQKHQKAAGKSKSRHVFEHGNYCRYYGYRNWKDYWSDDRSLLQETHTHTHTHAHLTPYSRPINHNTHTPHTYIHRTYETPR